MLLTSTPSENGKNMKKMANFEIQQISNIHDATRAYHIWHELQTHFECGLGYSTLSEVKIVVRNLDIKNIQQMYCKSLLWFMYLTLLLFFFSFLSICSLSRCIFPLHRLPCQFLRNKLENGTQSKCSQTHTATKTKEKSQRHDEKPQ